MSSGSSSAPRAPQATRSDQSPRRAGRPRGLADQWRAHHWRSRRTRRSRCSPVWSPTTAAAPRPRRGRGVRTARPRSRHTNKRAVGRRRSTTRRPGRATAPSPPPPTTKRWPHSASTTAGRKAVARYSGRYTAIATRRRARGCNRKDSEVAEGRSRPSHAPASGELREGTTACPQPPARRSPAKHTRQVPSEYGARRAATPPGSKPGTAPRQGHRGREPRTLDETHPGPGHDGRTETKKGPGQQRRARRVPCRQPGRGRRRHGGNEPATQPDTAAAAPRLTTGNITRGRTVGQKPPPVAQARPTIQGGSRNHDARKYVAQG